MGSGIPPDLKKKKTIKDAVDDQNSSSKHHLGCTCQAWRIEQDFNIVFNKPSLVAGNTALPAQPVLQRRQRTYTASEFNPGGPDHGREVKPAHVSSPEYHQAAKDSKKYECKVQHQHHISGYLIYHLFLKKWPSWLGGFV